MPYQTISQLAGEVILKVENRTSDLNRAYQWLMEATLELLSSADLRGEFDNMEVLGPFFNLTSGTREYDFSNLLQSGDYNDGTLDIRIWTNFPTNTTTIKLRFISYEEADSYSNNPGRPSAWYRFADLFGFDLIPDNSYQIQSRYQKQHPFLTPLQNSPVMLPLDWYDVVVLVAAQKGFLEMGQYEKAQAIYMALHGDPSDPEKPGLINCRKKRYEREAWRTEKSLRVHVPTYSRRTR